MYSLKKPSDKQIQAFLSQQERAPFSYSEVGVTRQTLPPRGYIVDHYRIKLGHGEKTFRAGQSAVSQWTMFQMPWIHLCSPNTPPVEGATRTLLVRCFKLWALFATRVVYLIDEKEPMRRFGFAYGTLPAHAEQGEERFTVEWLPSDDSVWYDILAFSRPNQLLLYLAYPYIRHLQKRFGRASLQAMVRAAANPPAHFS